VDKGKLPLSQSVEAFGGEPTALGDIGRPRSHDEAPLDSIKGRRRTTAFLAKQNGAERSETSAIA
jgi:hypothetical protein